MDIFDRKKQGGVFGTCYAHKNIHYHDPKGSVFLMDIFLYKGYVPLLVYGYQKWYFVL